MSIPNEALQKLLQEIEQKAAISQQQIAVVKAQIAGKNRENRMLQLTATELDPLPRDSKVYDGIGKMFVLSQPSVIQEKLAAQSAEIKATNTNLEKRLQYLETTAKNSRDHIEQMLRSGGRA